MVLRSHSSRSHKFKQANNISSLDVRKLAAKLLTGITSLCCKSYITLVSRKAL